MYRSNLRIALVLAPALALTVSLTAAPASGEPSGATAAPDSPALGFSPANMDRSTDPRRDFYRYAAGGWLDRAVIPPSEKQASQFADLAAGIDRQLLAIIREAAAATEGQRHGPLQQIGDFYRSAMDLDRIEHLGLSPLAGDFARAAAVDSAGSLGTFAGRLDLAYGGNPFIQFGVLADAKQSDMNVLYAAPAGATLNRSEYLEEANRGVRDLYTAHVAEMLELAGDARDLARRRAESILAIERELAAGTLSPVEAADPNATYHRMSVAELQALVPRFDLTAHLESLGLEPPAFVVVTEPRAIANVERVLEMHTPDEIRTLLRWRVLNGFPDLLPARFARADREFARRHAGLEESPTREREVTGQIRALFAHPLSRLYVERHFPETTRAAVQEMVDHVRAEFRDRLEKNSWLTAETRAQALVKLDRVRISVGYPEKWIDMSGVVVDRGTYLANVQRAIEFSLRRGLANLGKPVHPDQFSIPSRTTPVDVNAGYMRPYNAIEISAAILQPPFFDPRLDAAVNYCTIGAVIGHELTHGFDSGGRLYDSTGTLRNWWTDEDAGKFKAQTALLVKQFDGYEILPGVHVNGELTVGENTADLGGMTLGLQAFERSITGKPRPGLIDGLTAEQRCFVAWAQLWMSKTRPEAARQSAATDPHADSAFRASGPLVHLDAFFDAFGIVAGDPMWREPAERVRIW